MSEIIEDCLRAKGVRYFHGHHEQEYFFLLDFLDQGAETGRPGKLHVHLDRAAGGSEITVTVTPNRYYPAAAGDRFSDLVARWSLAAGAHVGMHRSSDPALVGVSVATTTRPAVAADLTAQIDETVTAAMELFGLISPLAEVAPSEPLRDAG